jgi:hypothetical protein
MFKRYAIAASVAVPGTVLAHELGHLVAAWLYGFEQVQLHAQRVSYWAHEVTPSALAVVAAAGPAVTAALVGLAPIALRWPEAVAVAVVAPQRCFASVIYLATSWAGEPWVVPSDEARLATLSGTSTAMWAAISAGVLAGGLIIGVRQIGRLPRESWGSAAAGLTAGCAVGWAIQLVVVRWLLP